MNANVDINISSTNGKVEDIMKTWSNNSVELEGRPYVNPQTGTLGFFISQKGDNTNIIEVFIKKESNIIDKL